MSEQQKYDAWHARVARHENAVPEPTLPWHLTVARLLPDLGGKRVLEVGCGRGDFAIWLAGRFPNASITAVDFSPAAIEIARRRAHDAGVAVHFEVGDAEAMGFEAASFDYVISCECLEHVPHPDRMAAEIARVLQPGGRFILTTENYFNGMLVGWAHAWLTNRPFNSGSGVQPRENFFLFWRVKGLLKRGGLRVDHMESNAFQWLLLPRVDPASLATTDFSNPFLKRLFRAFGRHFTFVGGR